MYFMYIVNVMYLKPPSPKEVKQNCGKTVQTYKFQSLVVTVRHSLKSLAIMETEVKVTILYRCNC